MQRLRLALCLTFFPAALAFLGGAAALDAGANVAVGLAAGALAGLFFGLVFGGVRGKWLDKVFGPEDEEEEGATAPRYPASDESFNRLNKAGWSLGETQVLELQELRWRVSGVNGENVIDATEETQAEVWHKVMEQGGSLGMLGR